MKKSLVAVSLLLFVGILFVSAGVKDGNSVEFDNGVCEIIEKRLNKGETATITVNGVELKAKYVTEDDGVDGDYTSDGEKFDVMYSETWEFDGEEVVGK